MKFLFVIQIFLILLIMLFMFKINTKKYKIFIILMLIGIGSVNIYMYFQDSNISVSTEEETVFYNSYEKFEKQLKELLIKSAKTDLEKESINTQNLEIVLYQLDDDDDLEIIVNNEGFLYEINFWVIDKIDDEYAVVFSQKDIEKFNVYNNSILLLTTKTVSPGTDMGSSKYNVYLNSNNIFTEIFSDDHYSYHAYYTGNTLTEEYGKIRITNEEIRYVCDLFSEEEGKEDKKFNKTETYKKYKLDELTKELNN